MQEGVKEIWMTSEDTGAYGRDIGTSLPAMLDLVIAALPEGTMLRLGMTNPPYILEHVEVWCHFIPK
jgi:threonylcarbamoyladenosine tRNA methylthiotransferase CDKAL1